MHNIVLTGFMGVGKSTIGRQVAQRLGFEFVDLDTLLEGRQGCTIRAIFETEGETHFRHLEAELCREVALWPQHVIATGGGALVDLDNQAAFAAHSLVICLDCDPEALWQRLATSQNRPMLDSPDRKARLLALLAERQPAYAHIAHHVDTTYRPINTVVRDVYTLWQQQTGVNV